MGHGASVNLEELAHRHPYRPPHVAARTPSWDTIAAGASQDCARIGVWGPGTRPPATGERFQRTQGTRRRVGRRAKAAPPSRSRSRPEARNVKSQGSAPDGTKSWHGAEQRLVRASERCAARATLLVLQALASGILGPRVLAGARQRAAVQAGRKRDYFFAAFSSPLVLLFCPEPELPLPWPRLVSFVFPEILSFTAFSNAFPDSPDLDASFSICLI